MSAEQKRNWNPEKLRSFMSALVHDVATFQHTNSDHSKLIEIILEGKLLLFLMHRPGNLENIKGITLFSLNFLYCMKHFDS